LNSIAPSPWLAGETMSQADITTIVMYDFARIVNAQLIPNGRYRVLDALAATCATHPAFEATRPAGEVDQVNPSLQNTSS